MSEVLARLPVDAAYPHVVDAADTLERALAGVPADLRTTVLRRLGWRIEELRLELQLAAAGVAGERARVAALALEQRGVHPERTQTVLETAIAEVCDAG